MTYYLEDNPNPNTPQYGWERSRVSGVIGVHTTESGVDMEGDDQGAENTAAFIARRTDYGSYHILADWDTIVPLTRPTFAAWADTTNNVHAMSVSGAMDAARWRDLPPERAAQIVRNMGIAAAMLVHDAIAHGLMDQPTPAVRITAAEAIAGSRPGFYGHGETNPGTRYDPGSNFDWDLFLASYAAAVGGTIQYQSTTVQEDDMAQVPQEEWDGLKAQVASLVDNVATKEYVQEKLADLPRDFWSYTNPNLGGTDAYQKLLDTVASTDELASGVAKVAAQAASSGATVEQITDAVKKAISESVVKVDVSVEGAAK